MKYALLCTLAVVFLVGDISLSVATESNPACRNTGTDKIVIWGSNRCDSCRELRQALDHNQIPFTFHDVHMKDTAAAWLKQHRIRRIPATCVCGNLILGGGPAGAEVVMSTHRQCNVPS